MSTNCDYCHGPSATALHGRPRPRHEPAVYCCYGCLSLGEQPPSADRPPFAIGTRLALAVSIAAQSMIFGLALNLNDDVPAKIRLAVHTVLLAGAVLSFALLGGPLLRAAWQRRLTLEALFLLTLTGAMAASVQAMLVGGSVYFEVVSILLAVYTVGKSAGARSRAAALGAAEAWSGELETCRRSDGIRVSVADVRPGERIEVAPGERIAIDGTVVLGRGFLSEAALTGEPFPVVKQPGDRVRAGSIAHEAAFTIAADGPHRQIDRLLASVAAARQSPLPMQTTAEHLNRVFLPLVVAVAVGTFAYWLRGADFSTALFHAMSVLLVACPCVIGLATPIVMANALARLAERGLLVRTAVAVERLARIDRVVFDKTGTLTEERFALVEVRVEPGVDRGKLLRWLAAAEAKSTHPVAAAFAGLAETRGVSVTRFTVVPGAGIEAAIVDAGESVLLRAGHFDPAVPAGEVGFLPLFLDGRRAGTALVAERLRGSARDALADFHAMNLPVAILTGDQSGRAETLGLRDVTAEQSPDDKRRHLAGGRALMVGDGINDAPALAAAHVGVALASGADLAVAAADLTLYHGDLRVLPWAVALSRAAMTAVRRSLLAAVAYNAVGMCLAAAGLLHPVAAVLLMMLSSLTLVVFASRVGVRKDHCRELVLQSDASASPWKATIHGSAIALQAALAAALLNEPAAGLFAIVALPLALLWQRWRTIPHTLDMVFGMLSLGNLGMLLGWWIDLGFRPIHCLHCCSLAAPGMWLGMLAFGNFGMVALGRRPLRRDTHAFAMLTGGNCGMVFGMALGGQAASAFATPSLAAHFFGMTIGMIAGMLLGTRFVEALRPGQRTLSVRRPAGRSSTPSIRTR